MIWKFFKRDKDRHKREIDPLKDLTLDNLKKGSILDYDMKTWEVTGHNKYEWSGGLVTDEWELSSAEEIIYLECEGDDEVEWMVTKKIPFSKLGKVIRKAFSESEEPPEEIFYEGGKYYLDGEGAGLFYKDREETGIEFLSWDYINEEEDKILTIEQWGEKEFEASTGYFVEEYQFTNILPGK